MQSWKTLARETVFRPDGGRFVTVENHHVQLPDGTEIEDWAWVRTPEFINVVVETNVGDYLCFRQYKYAAQGPTLGIVGGYLDPDEAPLAAAKRELLEETGYAAPEWTALGSYPIDGNRGCGVGHLFFACGAQYVQEPDADDLEEQEILFLSRTELEAALLRGEFRIITWSAAVAMALLHLRER